MEIEENKGKKLKQILEEIGLVDTMTLTDERTMQLINMFKYYSSPATPPAPFNSKIWFDTILILQSLQPRLF